MLSEELYFNEPRQQLCGLTIPHIHEEPEAIARHQPIVDRYFQRFYYVRESHPDEDHLVLFHSNRICMIGLAPEHIALKKGIKTIDFNIGNCDRSQNQVKGKGKKGGMVLQPTTALAVVTCEDGSEYKICSCITGKLIETNDNLGGDGTDIQELLKQEGNGYVAIVLPKIEHCDSIKEELITYAKYNEMKGRNC